MTMERVLALSYVALGALACAVGCGYVLSAAALPRVSLGVRGQVRARALERGAFCRIEPIVRWLAARIAHWPLSGLRAALERTLLRSGSFLGLCADELLALSVLSSAGCAAFALCVVSRLPLLWLAFSLAIGGLLPLLVLLDHKRGRDRKITRQVPAALDLLALGLNAGLDFTASIELVMSSLVEPDDPLREELALLRQELAMGRARMRALRSLAGRSDVPAIRDLVRVIIQADRKGAPLAAVLETQAQVARNRRSVLAEEAAARASILLLGPLMVMLIALLLLLLGPLVIRHGGS